MCGGRVLELGCGTGRVTAPLAKTGAATVVGIDRSEAMLARGQKRLRRGRLANARLLRADIRQLPFAAGAFETVIAPYGILQCGDPSATGMGGPGYSFADELDGDEQYLSGTIAMANAGPDTNGSQFFLVFSDSPFMPDYTTFGTIDEAGVELLTEVGAGGVGADGVAPAKDVTIEAVSLS